jgi:pre-mRNA-splicing factor CDC5/CEF1
MTEARNIRTLSMQQTPLLGEENTPLRELLGRGSGFEGATPRGGIAATPNPLATPLRSNASDVGATPRSVMGSEAPTPLRTPMRDSLSINNDDMSSMGGDTPRMERLRLNDVKNSLRKGFASLPEPKNEFELVMPEDEANAEEEMSEDVKAAMRIEDSSDREARLKAIKAAEVATVAARRSQAVKRGLPRPVDFNAQQYLTALDDVEEDVEVDSRAEFERLIAIEMVQLLEHDAILYPVAGSKRAGGGASRLETISDDALAAARSAVHLEIAKAVGLPGANETILKRTVRLDDDAFNAIWSPLYNGLTYHDGSYIRGEGMKEEDKIKGFAKLLELNRSTMGKEASKAAKVEKKLGVVLGGYQARSKALGSKMISSYEELSLTRLELNSFDRLASNERGAMQRRMESLRDEVEALERKEREGQGRFRELMEIKQALLDKVEDLEIREAEEINERAMMAMEE